MYAIRSYYVLKTFNRKYFSENPLALSNNRTTYTSQQIDELFGRIGMLSNNGSNDCASMISQAILSFQIKDFSTSLKYIESALKISPDEPILLLFRAVVQYKMAEIVRSVQLAQSNNLLLNSGGTKANTGDSKKEILLDFDIIMADYNKIIKLEPTFAVAYFNRANLKAAKKDHSGAIEDYSEAIRLDPEMAEAYYNRGLTQIYLGKTTEGARDLSKSYNFV